MQLIKVEPYWNVNLESNYLNVCYQLIKVEPYWNVNFSAASIASAIVIIKVEPYWNVNRKIGDEEKNSKKLK